MNHSLQRQRSRALALVALFAALMAVMGLIPKIDLPLGVPVTLQSLGVMLAGCLLGARRGFQSMALFLLAVAIGLPLLAGGRGGLAPFMAPSAGYLLAYAPAAGLTGWIMGRLATDTPRRAAGSAFLASMFGGLLFLHAMGIAGLVWLANMPLGKAVVADLVFVPGDLIKCVLCALVVHTVAKAMPDWRMGGEA